MAIVYTNQSSGYSRKNKKKMNSLSANQLAEFKEDLRIHNKQYTIVPAYNKGPYMVVGKEDLKTAGRKV